MKHLKVVRTKKRTDNFGARLTHHVHVVALSQVASAELRKKLAVKGASLKKLSSSKTFTTMLETLLNDKVDDVCLRRGIETNRYYARVVTTCK